MTAAALSTSAGSEGASAYTISGILVYACCERFVGRRQRAPGPGALGAGVVVRRLAKDCVRQSNDGACVKDFARCGPDVRRGDVWKALTRDGEQYLTVLSERFLGIRSGAQWIAVAMEGDRTPRCVHAVWLSTQTLVTRGNV